jgi:hypothetical protein
MLGREFTEEFVEIPGESLFPNAEKPRKIADYFKLAKRDPVPIFVVYRQLAGRTPPPPVAATWGSCPR